MGEPLSRRDFLKGSVVGVPAAILGPKLDLLARIFEVPLAFGDRLDAAKKNLDLFLAASGQKIPETGTPVHPDARTNEDIMSAFYPPLLDWRILRKAWTALSRAKDSQPETAAQRAAETAIKGFVQTDYYSDVVMGGPIKAYFGLPNAVNRWQSFNPEPLRSPEPGRFSNQELQGLADSLISMFPVPGVVREAPAATENIWGSSGKERLEIVTQKILELDEPLRRKMFVLVFGHELAHLLDILMSGNLGTIFRYLSKGGGLFELFSLRSRADAIQTLAADGHTQLQLFLGGNGVKNHPWEFFAPDNNAQRVWQSLLINPTAIFQRDNLGAYLWPDPQNEFLAAFMDFDENRIDYYLSGVISRQFPDGLTPNQIQTTDWLKVKDLGLAGAALETFKQPGVIAGLLGEETSVPVPPRRLGGLLGPRAVQLLTAGEYTGPIPPAVLRRFYWGSILASREFLAYVGSLWFYLKSGLADERETKLLTEIFASNPQAAYLRRMVEVLDRERLTSLIERTRAGLETTVPVLAQSGRDIKFDRIAI